MVYNDAKIMTVLIECIVVLGDLMTEAVLISHLKSLNVSEEFLRTLDDRLGYTQRPFLGEDGLPVLPEQSIRVVAATAISSIPPPVLPKKPKTRSIVTDAVRSRVNPSPVPPSSLSQTQHQSLPARPTSISPVPPLTIDGNNAFPKERVSSSLAMLKRLRGTVSAKTTPQHNKVRRKAMSAGLLQSSEDRRSLLYSTTWPSPSANSVPVSAPVSPVSDPGVKSTISRQSMHRSYNSCASPSLSVTGYFASVRSAIQDLYSSEDWERVANSIKIIQNYAADPQCDYLLLKESLTGLVTQAGNLRSQVAKNALVTLKPVCLILGRNIDSDLAPLFNGFISEAANDTLISVIEVVSCTKALNCLGPHFANLNALIRGEAVAALLILVKQNNSSTLNNAFYEKIINLCGNFLGDASPVVRGNAKKVLEYLNSNGLGSLITGMVKSQRFSRDISAKLTKLLSANTLSLEGSSSLINIYRTR
ncbi:hypothetical protein GEMRC1_002593 [Eukaryota sp. GEM-RC1]